MPYHDQLSFSSSGSTMYIVSLSFLFIIISMTVSRDWWEEGGGGDTIVFEEVF